MKNFIRYLFWVGSVLSVATFCSNTGMSAALDFLDMPEDSDEITLPYPIRDRHGDLYAEPEPTSPLFMGNPSNIKQSVEYDPENNRYNINENMGELFYRNPSYLSFDEFVDREFKKSTRNYWRQRATEEDKLNQKVFSQKIQVKSVVFDRIFGGNTIDIRPQGSAELTFGIRVNKTGNPAVPEEQRSVTSFDFDESIQMNVIANIGDKLKLSTNYNTESSFDFENKMKLEYTGYEDDIIKKIDAGNVSLPLNSQLIQGSMSLFGIKTQLQFGRMTVTALFSQQKGKSQTINVEGGALTTPYEIRADQYEAYKHYFLAQYFKDQYDSALSDLNQIRSGVNITKIEVWVTNRANSTAENRNIVAFTDLGEYNFDTSQQLITLALNVAPDDNSNNLYQQLTPAELASLRTLANANTVLAPHGAPLPTGENFTSQKNYEIRELARKLNSTEYTLNAQLGYISLNAALDPGQILAVAYEYTLNGQVHHVGELSTTSGVTAPQALFVKLIKSTQVDPKHYTWDLMMKNIYSLGAYQIDPTDFRLDVLYQSDQLGSNINYIPVGCATIKGIPLIKLFNLDDLNVNHDPQPDGVFDFMDGITINAQNGRVIFPVREPFGSYLRSKFCVGEGLLADQYAYDALYDSTKSAAQQQPERNKFILKGQYKSSSGADIPLNSVQVQQGSVKVTAGGVQLVENVDFTVDYTLGRVKIINEGILKSNTPIQVTHESNQSFDIQTKRMMGARFDYYVNKDVSVGGTIMNLTERPLTQKINIGDEPISNTVIGLDGTYKSDSRVLTKLLDKLPFYSTKEVSSVTMGGEFAQIIPGHSKAIGSAGTSYIDDFEGAVTPLDINNPGFWQLASTPQGQLDPAMFPEGASGTGLAYGFNRALVSWYRVDPLFQSEQSMTPDHITAQDMSNNYVREVPEVEIFPQRKHPDGPQVLYPMNVAFYPSERGPYNYDAAGTQYSDGLNPDGSLANPTTRWGGIMRKIETTDFEASNIEYIEFWMMDPFADNSPNDNTGGDLYFNLGSISEDILRDDHKMFENGLPTPANNYTTENSIWGRYPNPNIQAIGNAFDNDEASRGLQDIGMDGLTTVDERVYHDTDYIQEVATAFGTGSQAYTQAVADPSADNYRYFQSDTYNALQTAPLDRYKYYNNMEGNSPAPPEVDGYFATSLTSTGDMEDVNRDNNMDTYEAYFQYHIDLRPGRMLIGQNYITDIVDATPNYEDGHFGTCRWYQFKIPVQNPEQAIGGIDNFKNIQFIRMFMKNFNTPVICRFAQLELIRGDWRKYNFSLLSGSEFSPPPEVPGNTLFDVTAVNYEENSGRQPINYVLPPGIEQEAAYGPSTTYLNEQALSLKVCNLEDGDARAVYKTTQIDMRAYKKIRMFSHVESVGGSDNLRYGDLTIFIRLGSDFSQNYYEYEIPLTPSQWGSIDPYAVWPEANNLDLELEKLIDAKLQRNNAISTSGGLITLLTPYIVQDGTRKITIRGSPNLSSVRAIMVGVRNPKSPSGVGPTACAEVWINEMRMTDFDESGGWASIANVSAKLADLGNMTLTGRHSVAGWGSIEKRVSERDREDRTAYDFSTAIEAGKFLPPKSGVSVPVFFSYSEQFINPQYNPLDPDVKFSQALSDAPNEQAKDSIKKAVQDYTQRKSINFTNVRKTRTGKTSKPKVYDVENLSFSYSYNELYQRNYATEYNVGKSHTGTVAYNYSTQPKMITPFAKTPGLSSSWLKLVKDFNFNYIPSNFNFAATVNRGYQETQLRNNTGLPYVLPPTFIKTFTWNRLYGFQYDITKSLKFDFNASANATVDEPAGRIDTEEKKDTVKRNFWSFGRLTNYHHAFNVTYNVPFAKIPLTDWITGNIRYGTDYSWMTGALTYYPNTNTVAVNSYGNSVQNSQSINYSANFNLVNLYNKSTYLRKVNTDNMKPKAPAPKPKPPKSPLDSLAAPVQPPDSLKKPSIIEPIIRNLAKLLMMVKSTSFTYTETNGILLPGFRPRPDALGLDFNWFGGGPPAPGWGFIAGSQDTSRLKSDIRNYHWLTDDTTLNAQLIFNFQQNFSARATVEPVKNFKIDLSANRNYSLMHSEYFRDNGNGEYNAYSPTEQGNFSISYFTWNTSFVNDGIGFSNANFDNFDKNRREISHLLAEQNPNSVGLDSQGYSIGYGATQQEVLTYSFLSAYTGKAPSANIIDRFPKVPRPNWRITWDGLGKMPWARKMFTQISFSHGYRSMYSVNSFTQNLLYQHSSDNMDIPTAFDAVGNFIPRYDIQQISISEQFSPLISADVTLKNSLQARFEIRRDRTLTLAYSNIQVTEVRGVEYIVGIGYRIKNMKVPFQSGGRKTRLPNDVNLKADIGLRDNTTIIRKLTEGTNQASAGNKMLTIKLSADYNINERFNVRVFFDRYVNTPFVSASYPTSETSAGVKLRFTLAQ